MECNRETSSDGTTSSAPPVCAAQNPDALVPCCNNNCHFFGCAATMNLCSKCYSEHILKEGGAFLNKPCDSTVDTAGFRPDAADGTDEANPCISVDGEYRRRIADAPVLGGSMVVDDSSPQESQSKSVPCTPAMSRSVGVSDLRAIFGVAETSSARVRCGSTSDLPRQQIPSPLSLSSGSIRAFSPVRQRQVETKLTLPPLPRQQAVNRCLTCRKRVGLLGFKCKCGDTFCALHRYSDKHACSFDYKAAGRAAIAKENPVVKASKIEKI